MRTLILLLTTAALLLPAADSDIEKAMAERDAAITAGEADYAQVVAKAQSALDDITAKADDKAVASLERTAKRAARGGDMATGAAAWKAVLGIDREHQEARGYFEAVGNLDVVLAELAQADQDAANADLLGGPAPATGAGAADGSAAPLAMAAIGTFGQVQVHPLKEGTNAIGGIATPITAVPGQLTGASFIQPQAISTEYLRCRIWQAGAVAIVAGPGYGGVGQIQQAGFAPADFVLGVSDADQRVFVKEMGAGEELNLPPGHVMVMARTIRALPAALLGVGGGMGGRR